MKRLLPLLLLTSSMAFGQAWSTFLDPSRAIDWTSAGFTIPSYSVNCSTQPTLLTGAGNAGANATAIQNALASCDATHNVVNIAAGTFSVGAVTYPAHGKQVIRGAGPNSTKLISTAQASCEGFNAGFCMIDATPTYTGSTEVLPGGVQACNSWATGYAQGSTSITVTGCGGTPPVGGLLMLDQADDSADTGGVYVCDETTPASCNYDGTGGSVGRIISGKTHSQVQVTHITSVSGSAGNFTITISPGVYFTNIRSGQVPGAWWPTITQLNGLENLSIDGTADSFSTVGMYDCYQCWVKNVTLLNGARTSVFMRQSGFDVIRDSYFYQAQGHASVSYNIEPSIASAFLIENNIMQQTTEPAMFNGGTGGVIDYNYGVDQIAFSNYTWGAFSGHSAGNSFNLWEGNNWPLQEADDAWGSATQQVYFRNFYRGWELGRTQGSTPIIHRSYNRVFSLVGNVLGQPGYHTGYQTIATGTTTLSGGSEALNIFTLGTAFDTTCGTGTTQTSPFCDTLAVSTMMRWANYDTVNAAVRFNTTEAAPTAVTYAPANFTTSYFGTLSHTLPASLYYSSKPSWWPSAKAWPPIGPDVVSGNVGTCSGTYSGAQGTSSSQCTGGTLSTAWASHVTSIPAQDCALNVMAMKPDGTGSVSSYDYAACAAAAPTNNTFYIRPDGGTRWTAAASTGQCDGKADVSYASTGGTGVNQHCAFGDIRSLWDDLTYGNYPNWAISGGDTVIVRKNTGTTPWRVGFTGNGSTTDPQCYGGAGAGACIMPPIPSGTAIAHTQFLGENYAACSTTRTIMTVSGPRVQAIPDVSKTTKISGGHAAFLDVNLAGSQYVDVSCLDLSSFEPACQLQGSPQPNPCNRSAPLSDYMGDGLETSNTSGNLLIQDIYIHGTNSRGIHGQQGTGPVTANRVWISITPQTGWDFDDSTASGTAPWTMTNSIIEASGCQQSNTPTNYPPLSDAQLFQNMTLCYSQGSGAVIGDGIGTPPNSGFNVTMDSNVFQWNTQDGEDFGHMDTGSFSFTLTNNVSQHNMGQTFKNGWAFNTVTWLNNISNADCARMVAGNNLPGGVPLTVNQYLVDGCRAGDNYSINFQHATNMLTANNTMVTYQPTTFDFKCVATSNDCSASVWNINNNIILAYVNPAVNSGIAPADFCGPSCNGPPFTTIGTINRKNNIYFNLRACHANVVTPDAAAGTSTGESCVNPKFVSEPASPMASYTSLDGFNFNITGTSPAIAGGVSYTGILANDYAGNAKTTPPVIGALNNTGGAPTLTTITVLPNPASVTTSTTVNMQTASFCTFSDSSTIAAGAAGCVVTWSDTNAHSSINSSTGIVTGATVGSDTITATLGITGTATVNVSNPPSSTGVTFSGNIVISGTVKINQ